MHVEETLGKRWVSNLYSILNRLVSIKFNLANATAVSSPFKVRHVTNYTARLFLIKVNMKSSCKDVKLKQFVVQSGF